MEYNDLLEIDKWALSQTEGLLKEVTAGYENFEFHKVIHLVYNFCVIDMSNIYLDIIKDRLYIFPQGSTVRRSAQSVLFRVLEVLMKGLAPILPFTMEEAFRFIRKENDFESIHLYPWPQPNAVVLNYPFREKWERLFKIRDMVMKALELKRSKKEIGDSLEASIDIYSADVNTIDFLRSFEDLKTIFIVSEINLYDAKDLKEEPTLRAEEAGLGFIVKRAKGNKCQRCWNYSETVGTNVRYYSLCNRCVGILETLPHNE
ncbi:MAG: class I tRNA ligase family protein [Candidatus Omnitrophica bacterium]|nr:class I tRNA ligase family protein [Candidatus Omnitrophota bacterium]